MAGAIKRLVVLAALASAAALTYAGSPSTEGQPKNPFVLAGWQAHDFGAVRYVGTEACAACHAIQATPHADTPMARALSTSADCDVLRSRPRLTFRDGPYTYQIVRRGNRSIYTVSQGANSISEPILYCFGTNVVGQTYVIRHEGRLYETRVSFFRAIDGLDVTIGQPRGPAAQLADAIGRPLAEDEARNCFGCHAPESVTNTALQLDHFAPGLTCESCHGPGEAHVAAVKVEPRSDLRIFNPGKLSANDLTQEFCGTCHIGFGQAMLMPGQGGASNIRFQAYRLLNSKGHGGDDPRISCIACHNPHEPLERDPASYDKTCLACHLSNAAETATEARKARACPTAANKCVTCHMPKVELDGMHAKFTDHWIRVAKPGDPVPH